MAEVPVSKAAARFVDAWEAAVRERLAEKPPQRYDRRVLLGPYFSPEKLRHGLLAVGGGGGDAKGRVDVGDGRRLDRLARSNGWRRSRGWPAGDEVSRVQELGVGLTRELSAGVGRGAASQRVHRQGREPQDRDRQEQNRRLADAIGQSVGRFHYPHVVDHLEATQTISPEVARAFRSGNDFAQDSPRERLVNAFAGVVDPVDRRNPADGRLLDRVHASEDLDKAKVLAEILVNRSPVLQQADREVRVAATERLTSVIGGQLATAMQELDRSRESQPARKDRAGTLGRRIGEDTQRTVARLEAEADPTPAADPETARGADAAAASRVAGEGVASASGGNGSSHPRIDSDTRPKDRGTGSRTPHGNAIG